MEGSKLIELLRTFSVAELRQFDEYLNSPLFNKRQDVRCFYQHLRKLAPEFSPKKTDAQKVWEKVFPGNPYSDREMKYLMSFTLKHAENFLGLMAFTKKPWQSDFYTLDELIDRELDKHFRQLHEKTTASLDALPWRDTRFFLDRYRLAEISNRFYLRQKVHRFDPTLQEAADNFDRYYFAHKLKYACEMMNRKRSIAADYQLTFVEELQNFLDRQDHSDFPPVLVYSLLLKTFQEEDHDPHFEKLYAAISKFREAFHPEELKEIYMYAINYCIRRVNRGNVAWLEQLHTLYHEAIENNLLLEQGHLSPWAFRNFVGVSLRLKKFDETETFITNWAGQLAPSFRENARNYNLAELHYSRGNTDLALTLLQKVEFSDIYYNLDTRRLMVKIFFEKEETDALDSMLQSFRVFLKRNKTLSAGNKLAYENFLLIVGKMMKRVPGSAPALLKKIKETTPIADRSWLLEMASLFS